MKDSNDIYKRIESEAIKVATEILGEPPMMMDDTIVVGFIAGAKWRNNELIEEAIEKLQPEIKSKYIGHIWIMNTIKEVLESLKIKP